MRTHGLLLAKKQHHKIPGKTSYTFCTVGYKFLYIYKLMGKCSMKMNSKIMMGTKIKTFLKEPLVSSGSVFILAYLYIFHFISFHFYIF